MAGYDGAYGGYAYGYQPSTFYAPFPDATHLLDGPGSSAYVRAPHGASYAYEGRNSAVSVSSFDFGRDYFEQYNAYSYRGASGSLATTYTYENHAIRTPGGFFDPFVGYYTTYPAAPGQIGTSTTYDVTTTAYDGEGIDRAFTSERSYDTSYGYTVNVYERETSASVGGQMVAGSGQFYASTAVTDAYGYTSYAAHSSTF